MISNSENSNEIKNTESADEKSLMAGQPLKTEIQEPKPDAAAYVPEERQVKKNSRRGIKSPKVFVPIIIAIVVIIVIVLVLVLGEKTSTDSNVTLQSVKSITSATSAVNRYSGVIETQKSETVSFDSSQKLDTLYVKEGDQVKKGDKLFSYNTDSINLSIQKMQIENEISQNTITSNNEQITQYQNLMAYASSSEAITYTAEIQELQASNAQLEYNIKTKTAEIAVKQKSLENAVITSPIDGTIKKISNITSTSSSDDDYDSSSDTSSYITITATGSLRVKGSVGEQNIYEITAGTDVIVRSRVDTSQTWTGTVTSVETQSTETESTDSYYYSSSSGESSTKYPFYVDLETTDGLIIGQHVTIEVDYGQSEVKEGLWLNSAWLTFEGENAYVLAARTAAGPAEKRQVTLGEYDENLDEYEITDGLTEAEYIALPENSYSESDYSDYDTDYEYSDQDYSDYSDEDVYADYSDSAVSEDIADYTSDIEADDFLENADEWADSDFEE